MPFRYDLNQNPYNYTVEVTDIFKGLDLIDRLYKKDPDSHDDVITNLELDILESEVAQSCPTLCEPMDCSLSGFSVHGIF